MTPAGVLLLALLAGTPLLLAVLGELTLELSGVMNIGLEGMMLAAAMAAVAGAKATGSVTAGFVAGVGGAATVALIFGWLTIARRADAIIAGAGLNFVAAGATSVVYGFDSDYFVSGVPRLASWRAGGITLPDPIALATWLLAPVALFVLLRGTRFGLVLRASGEAPDVVRLHGRSPERMRWSALGIEALLCGIAGAYVSLVLSSGFAENMIAGRGFIALAIVTFGRWRSLGSVAGVALFSISVALQYALQAHSGAVPFHLLLAVPYVVTLLVLVIFVREVRAPQALGKP